MSDDPILTVAVPTYNMAWCLEKNLSTYCDERLCGKLEVLCLNNASEDASLRIIQDFADRWPQIFSCLDRDSRGYGSSINAAISSAKGCFFRIVDADDWVDTDELVKLLDHLSHCSADIVLTDYQIVNMQNGAITAVRAVDKGVVYGETLTCFDHCIHTLPSIHGTTYRTALLRESGFFMQDNLFFVDEEYVILPYLYAKSVVYLPCDVYRYQVANPEQSTSPKNRAKYFQHRESILRRLIPIYQSAYSGDASQSALNYCFTRISKGIGDHFTTLYLYISDHAEGRILARAWRSYLKAEAPLFWPSVRRKAYLLSLLNLLHISLPRYEQLKKALLRNR